MCKIEYKIVFIDLDDSLLSNDLTISEQNKIAIRQAVQKGVKIIINTGRMYKAAIPYYNQLQLDTPIASYQGALIKNPHSEEVLFYKPLDIELARRILEFGQQLGIHMQFYLEDGYYVQSENKYTDLYYSQNKVKPIVVGKNLIEFLNVPPIKILFIDEPDRILKLYRDLTSTDKIFGDHLSICTSKPHYLEFNKAGITKGNAVEFLCNYYGIDVKQSIGIGDSYNDLPMIKQSGLGVAVANAKPDILRQADYVTASNQDQGVALAINKFIL